MGPTVDPTITLFSDPLLIKTPSQNFSLSFPEVKLDGPKVLNRSISQRLGFSLHLYQVLTKTHWSGNFNRCEGKSTSFSLHLLLNKHTLMSNSDQPVLKRVRLLQPIHHPVQPNLTCIQYGQEQTQVGRTLGDGAGCAPKFSKTLKAPFKNVKF